MTANIKKLMWKSALAVLSLAAITTNLSAAVALSITEDPTTEKITVNDPNSVIDSISYGTVNNANANFGPNNHYAFIKLKSGYDVRDPSGINNNYFFIPEWDNIGVNEIVFINATRTDLAAINFYSDITAPADFVAAVKNWPTYDNSFEIVDSTGAPLGNITFGYSAVPEPSTYLAGLSALGMLGLFGWRNRK